MNRFKKLFLASLIISAFSIVVVLMFTVDSTTIESLFEVRHEYILAAAALHALSYVIWGLRTKFMCKALGYKLRSFKAIEIVTSSTLAAAVTPSSAGGEPLRIHLLHCNDIPLGRATAVVICERIMDAILIFIAAIFTLYIFRDILSASPFSGVLLVGEIVSLSVLIMLLYGIWRPHHMKKGIHFIVNRTSFLFGKKDAKKISNVLEKVDVEIEHFHNSVWVFLTEGRRGLFYGAICTIVFWIVEYMILPVILLGLNQSPSYILAFATQVLLSIMMVVPATPGASGVAEFGAVPLFSMFVTSSMLGITVVAWRALTYYMNLLVGSFVSFKILKDAEFIKDFTNRKP